MQSWGMDAMAMRQLREQLAATGRPDYPTRPSRRAGWRHCRARARARVGWALIGVGARLAIPASAASLR